MTQERNNKSLPIVMVEDDFAERARKELSVPDWNQLKRYIEEGKHPLSPDTVGSLFQLYLNGHSIPEIHRLNKAFPYQAILWAQVKYGWREQREIYIRELQEGIRDKVVKAQLETTSLLSDLLSAAYQKHGDRIKKYLQTKNEADLGDALSIDSLHNLLKIVEGLQKVTGQSNSYTVHNKNEQSVNVNLNTNSIAGDSSQEMSSESAAQILEILAKEKRKGK